MRFGWVVVGIGLMGILMGACSGTPASFSIRVGNPPPQEATPQNTQNQKTAQAAEKPASPAVAPAQAQKDGIIVFNQGGPLPAGVTPPEENYLQPEEVLVTYFNADRFESNYGLGKILTPPSDKTKGEAEIHEFYHNGKYWVPGAWIITKSRPAVPEELKPDMLVLCGKKDDYGRRNYDRWFLGVVKSTDTLYKGEVTLEAYPHDAKPVTFQFKVENIRIILEPQLQFKKVGSNYMKVR